MEVTARIGFIDENYKSDGLKVKFNFSTNKHKVIIDDTFTSYQTKVINGTKETIKYIRKVMKIFKTANRFYVTINNQTKIMTSKKFYSSKIIK